jgi:vancomycin resistance protein YoaR
LDGSFASTQALLELAKKGKEVSFSKEELARYLSQDLSFFVTKKDTDLQSPCNVKNYSLALERIDTLLLAPGEHFNANRALAQVRGYCTGRGEANFLFYGGVCGMTAQLFRTALLHPAIEIVQRYPHNEWFVQYYGEQVGGDDAAIYEMSKQFEIKNAGTSDIYFRTKKQGNETFLVAINPRNAQWVEIKKETLSNLSATLERTIWEHQIGSTTSIIPLSPALGSSSSEEENILIKQERYDSFYIRKNYERR